MYSSVSQNIKIIRKSRYKGCNFLHMTCQWSYPKFREFRQFLDGPQSDFPFAGGDKNNEENQAESPSNYDYIQVNAVVYVTTLLKKNKNKYFFRQVRRMPS